MANRLALDMGLNLDAASLGGTFHMSSEEIELRRQVYWSLYCDDKLTAIYTGRVCSLLDVQGAVNLPSPFTPEQISTAGSDTSKMMRCNKKIHVHRGLIGLCRILENILLALYAPKPLYKGPQRISFLQSCTLELKTWFYELPADLRIDRPNDVPQVYTLHMVYHTCCILLFKPFLIRPKEAPVLPKTETIKRLEELCVESAKRICHAGKKYRQVFGSFRKSPISATHCILTATLVLIQYARPEPEFANTGRPCCTLYIEACLDILSELSTSWKPACRMRVDLIKYLYQKYPERIPNSLLQSDRKNLAKLAGKDTENVSVHPQQTLEQNLCPLMNTIAQDFMWDGAGQWGFNGGSEAAYNTQFALADAIIDISGQDGEAFMDDAFWEGMSFEFSHEAQI
ncbi:C6 transcription factor [Colletotrichum graminicola]|nr:C6 transcription factor [Colletotrichum graminicola]